MSIAEVESQLRAVKRAIGTLARTERMVRTYPVGNELSQNLLRELLAELGEVLPLDLAVRRDQLFWNDVPLLDGEQDRSDVAGRLYKDGVRTLRFSAGMGAEELERLIVSLATPIHPDDLSEDYVTRLWEAELPSIRVVAVDPYPDLDVPDEVLEGKFIPTAEIEDVGPLTEAEATVELPPLPEEAFRIAPEEAARIAREIEQAASCPPWSEFMIALFELLRGETRSDRIDELVALLEATMQRTLRDGRVDVASELLLRIGSEVHPRADQAVREALFRMGRLDRLQPLHDALEAGSCDAEGAERVFVLLGAWVPEALCSLLDAAGSERTRRFYADVLTKVGHVALDPVLRHVRTAQEKTRLHLVRVLGKLRDPRAAELLRSLARGGTAELRREAVRALASGHPSEASTELARAALGDPEAGVRLVALKCLASLGGQLELEPLLARVSSSEARALSDEELDLLYLAIGATNRREALAYLSARLRPGWIPRRSEAPAWRRAAGALARMRLEEANAVLEELAQSGRRELAEICAAALEREGSKE